MIRPAGGTRAIGLRALIDSGASITVIPAGTAEELQLAEVGRMRIRGVGGTAHEVAVYAVEIETAGTTSLVRAVGLGESALVGRDLLNQWTVTLRGPQKLVEIEAP
jgi:predicted aspartyl protease